MDFHTMHTLAQSIDRASYVIAGAQKETAKLWRETILLAAGVFGATASLLTIIIYVIIYKIGG